MQSGHCQKGMVFAINAPPTGDKTFQNYKAKAMGGGTSTVVATTTASYTLSYSAPAPPPTMSASSTDEQCQCVCNIDVSNGYPSFRFFTDLSAPNSLQGIGVFGGSVGNVQRIFPQTMRLIDSSLGYCSSSSSSSSSSPSGTSSPSIIRSPSGNFR